MPGGDRLRTKRAVPFGERAAAPPFAGCCWRWPSPRSSCCCSIGWRSSAETDVPATLRRIPMTLSIAHLQPIVALIAGVLILLVPRILNYIVAIYLIIVGIIGLSLVSPEFYFRLR